MADEPTREQIAKDYARALDVIDGQRRTIVAMSESLGHACETRDAAQAEATRLTLRVRELLVVAEVERTGPRPAGGTSSSTETPHEP